MHHDGKIDAPSGTARATPSACAEASSKWAPDPTEKEVVAAPARVARDRGIPIHAVRMRGTFAHQEVCWVPRVRP